MRQIVGDETVQSHEAFLAINALVQSVIAVQPLVTRQRMGTCETPTALLTFVWLLSSVHPLVGDHMGQSRETFLTHTALVGFVAAVHLLVALELLRRCKTPRASFACVRFLASMSSHMRDEI